MSVEYRIRRYGEGDIDCDLSIRHRTTRPWNTLIERGSYDECIGYVYDKYDANTQGELIGLLVEWELERE